jgi:hypothetical protein
MQRAVRAVKSVDVAAVIDPPPTAGMVRANFLPVPHVFELNAACVMLNDALGGFGCYLVGSSLVRRDYRDVDVRFILDDATFDRMFPASAGGPGRQHDALWSLMSITISLWLERRTGLPIDFQIQRQTNANADYPGQRRSFLGVFVRPPDPAIE